MTCGWHTSTYEWHAADIRIHTSDIWRVTYEYTRVKYEWYTSIYEWHTPHTNDTRVTYEWHTMTYEWHSNDIRMTCKIKLNYMYSVWSFSIAVFNILCGKNIALCGCEWFWLLGCSNFCIFHWNIPKLAKNFDKYHCDQKQV